MNQDKIKSGLGLIVESEKTVHSPYDRITEGASAPLQLSGTPKLIVSKLYQLDKSKCEVNAVISNIVYLSGKIARVVVYYAEAGTKVSDVRLLKRFGEISVIDYPDTIELTNTLDGNKIYDFYAIYLDMYGVSLKNGSQIVISSCMNINIGLEDYTNKLFEVRDLTIDELDGLDDADGMGLPAQTIYSGDQLTLRWAHPKDHTSIRYKTTEEEIVNIPAKLLQGEIKFHVYKFVLDGVLPPLREYPSTDPNGKWILEGMTYNTEFVVDTKTRETVAFWVGFSL